MYIEPKFFTTNTIHRNLPGGDIDQCERELSCGLMAKNKDYNYTSYCFKHYVGVYILSGRGRYIDDEGYEMDLYPGCYIQRLPSRRHNTFIDFNTKWLEFFICIGRSAFKGMAQSGVFDDVNPVLYAGQSQKLLSELLSYMERLRCAKDAELPYMLIEAQHLLCTINQMSRNQDNDDKSFIHSACMKIKESMLVGTNVKEIADALGIGHESFRKQFSKVMGIPPGEYMINERINAAKVMLLDNAMPIKEVASLLGYTDATSFTKQFKKYAGITPGEFIRR